MGQNLIRHPSVTVTSRLIFTHQCHRRGQNGFEALCLVLQENREALSTLSSEPIFIPGRFLLPNRNGSLAAVSSSSVDIPSFPPSIHDSLTVPQARTTPDSSVNNTSLLEVQIQKLLDQIEAAKVSDAESLELPICPEVWLGLSEKIPEDLGGRVQYSGGSLIITWPTNVHEVHSRIAHLFVPFETASPDEFVTVMNTTIPFSDGPYVGQNRTPDFAFGRSTDKLNKIAEMHLTRSEVACVIGLNFLTSAFNYPSPSPTPFTSLKFSAFNDAATVSLQDGVEYDGYTWAPSIRGTQMIIWAKEQDQIKEATKETWDITPTSDPETFAKAHADIITVIRRITRSVCSKSIFEHVYPNKSTLTIDWQGFVPNLELRMLSDSHRRWLHWAFPKSKSLAEESGVKILRRKVAKLYPESDDESGSPTAESSRAAKKGKTGKCSPHRFPFDDLSDTSSYR
ncbi:hypothetical protein C8R45DRAFT_1218625 [Mycena sanguinolenta]|nr:hypothetical protein C8R45DRAFT_1218625 [Mycena sanguinolenta]